MLAVRSADLFESHDFGPCRTVTVLFDAGLVRYADIFALDQSAFAEGESQTYLYRVENQPFVLDAHAEAERSEEVVLEDVGGIACLLYTSDAADD